MKIEYKYSKEIQEQLDYIENEINVITNSIHRKFDKPSSNAETYKLNKRSMQKEILIATKPYTDAITSICEMAAFTVIVTGIVTGDKEYEK